MSSSPIHGSSLRAKYLEQLGNPASRNRSERTTPIPPRRFSGTEKWLFKIEQTNKFEDFIVILVILPSRVVLKAFDSLIFAPA